MRPIAAGLADTTVDVTGTPVSIGWTWEADTRAFASPDGGETVVIAANLVDTTQ